MQLSAVPFLVLALLSAFVQAAEYPHRHVLSRRALPGLPGMSLKNLKHGNLQIGFLPGFGEPKGPNDITSVSKVPFYRGLFNPLRNQAMSMVGTYYRLSKNDPTLSGLDNQVDELLQQKAIYGGDNPVFVIALGVDSSISYVTTSVAKTLASKVASYNARGVTIYLRYLWEMNGDWYPWGQQPAAFKSSWRQVVKTVRANKKANKTYFLWSPNSRFGDIGAVHGGYSQYWPGAAYVDVIGLSFYSYGGQDRQNIAATPSFLTNIVKEYSRYYGAKYNKPFMLSETSASYTVNLDTGKPNSGGDSELKIKSTWTELLLSAGARKYLSGICIFEIIKDESATGNTAVRQEDFRLVMGAANVRKNTLKQLGRGT